MKILFYSDQFVKIWLEEGYSNQRFSIFLNKDWYAYVNSVDLEPFACSEDEYKINFDVNNSSNSSLYVLWL